MEATQQSLFDELGAYQENATTGQRFVNYLVDTILLYCCYLLIMFLVGVFAEVLFASGSALNEFLDTGIGGLLIYVLFFGITIGYYTIIEGASKGRTLGKLITGTVAVQEDGSTITWNNAFKRALGRIIPLEVFSGLSGSPWHDRIGRSIVVKKGATNH